MLKLKYLNISSTSSTILSNSKSSWGAKVLKSIIIGVSAGDELGSENDSGGVGTLKNPESWLGRRVVLQLVFWCSVKGLTGSREVGTKIGWYSISPEKKPFYIRKGSKQWMGHSICWQTKSPSAAFEVAMVLCTTLRWNLKVFGKQLSFIYFMV